MTGHRTLLICAAGVLALSACGKGGDKTPAAGDAAKPASTAAGPVAPPHRKPGLWTQTVAMGDFTQTTRLCLDDAVEAKVSLWGAQTSKEMCSRNETHRSLNGSWTFSAVCDMGSGGVTTTTGTATGDFGAKYRIEAVSTTTGASAPQMNGEHKMVVDAAWSGPCPDGFKAGDMELPGGMKINIAQMGAMKPPAK